MNTSGQSDLIDWLGLRRAPRFTRAPWLGGLAGMFLVLFIFLMIIGAAAALYHLFAALLTAPSAGPTDIRGMGFLLLGFLGAPFVLWRAMVAQKQANTAEQGLITDRINKAVEGLGAKRLIWNDGQQISEPNLEVRIGAIFALERVAQDSPRDHIQIMEILCAYVRENAPAANLEPSQLPFERAKPRTDIQTAINVIGRRTPEQIVLEWAKEFRLDLRETDLSGVDFYNGDFSAVRFDGSRLEAASFARARLLGTRFNHCLLNYTTFHQGKLVGTMFDNATYSMSFQNWDLSFFTSELKGVSFSGADFSGVRRLEYDNKSNSTFGTKDTKLSPDLDEKRLSVSSYLDPLNHADASDDPSKTKKHEEALLNSGFRYWSPFDASDLYSNKLYKDFFDAMDLHGFPYR